MKRPTTLSFSTTTFWVKPATLDFYYDLHVRSWWLHKHCVAGPFSMFWLIWQRLILIVKFSDSVRVCSDLKSSILFFKKIQVKKFNTSLQTLSNLALTKKDNFQLSLSKVKSGVHSDSLILFGPFYLRNILEVHVFLTLKKKKKKKYYFPQF